MAFLGKKYTLSSQENFDGFLRSSGVGDEKIKVMLAEKPTQMLTKNGDTYTLSSSSPSGPKEVVFTPGVEFDDVIGIDKLPIKTTYVVEGNTVTQIAKNGPSTAIFKREFNENDLIVTITSDRFDGVAKRYYKA